MRRQCAARSTEEPKLPVRGGEDTRRSQATLDRLELPYSGSSRALRALLRATTNGLVFTSTGPGLPTSGRRVTNGMIPECSFQPTNFGASRWYFAHKSWAGAAAAEKNKPPGFFAANPSIVIPNDQKNRWHCRFGLSTWGPLLYSLGEIRSQ